MLSNTIYLDSPEALYAKYEEISYALQGECHFVTGQPEAFIVYEIVAGAFYRALHPDGEHKFFLRYPDPKAPKDLTEHFVRYPVCDDYDTASSAVGSYLIAASRDLGADERDESALGIFLENDRQTGMVSDFVRDIFRIEHLNFATSQDEVDALIKRAPLSQKAGVITQIILPRNEFEASVYSAEAYGIPNKEGAQLRFLPSGAKRAESVRYTCIPQRDLDTYAACVQAVVNTIVKRNRVETERLLHNDNFEVRIARSEWNIAQSLAVTPREFRECALTAIACGDYVDAEELIECADDKNHLYRALALGLIDEGKKEAVNKVLDKMNASAEKNLVISFAMNRFSDEADLYKAQLSKDFSADFELLMAD